MSGIETRVDAKLVDLSRREMALADAEAKPATGAPLALDETILAPCRLSPVIQARRHRKCPASPYSRRPGIMSARASTRQDAGRADRRNDLRERDTVSDRTR